MTPIKWNLLTTSASALELYRYGRGKNARTARRIQDTFNKAKRNAAIREIPFVLKPEEFVEIWRDDCVLCGKKFSYENREDSRSIDRIETAIGYCARNVRLTCTRCNFLREIHAIADRRRQKRKREEPWL